MWKNLHRLCLCLIVSRPTTTNRSNYSLMVTVSKTFMFINKRRKCIKKVNKSPQMATYFSWICVRQKKRTLPGPEHTQSKMCILLKTSLDVRSWRFAHSQHVKRYSLTAVHLWLCSWFVVSEALKTQKSHTWLCLLFIVVKAPPDTHTHATHTHP